MNPSEPSTATIDLTGVAERLRAALLHSRVNGKDFAENCGVPYSTMRTYLDRGRAPSAEFLVGMYRAYGVMPSWVLTGDEPMLRSGPAAQPETVASEFVKVPQLSVSANAGNGFTSDSHQGNTSAGLCFRRDWLIGRRLNPSSLAVLTVRGASMQGVLADGDQVLVDVGDTHPRSGYVYVLRQGDELLVKYCQLLPGGILRVSSANNLYAPYDVNLNDASDVQIVGRVVASMHEW